MRPTDNVSVYHDRIRELVSQHLSREQEMRCHERLAIALESAGAASTNPHALVRHAEAAGAVTRAAEFAEMAAHHAVEAVAFDRAVEFLRTSLRLAEHDEDKTLALRTGVREEATAVARMVAGAPGCGTDGDQIFAPRAFAPSLSTSCRQDSLATKPRGKRTRLRAVGRSDQADESRHIRVSSPNSSPRMQTTE